MPEFTFSSAGTYKKDKICTVPTEVQLKKNSRKHHFEFRKGRDYIVVERKGKSSAPTPLVLDIFHNDAADEWLRATSKGGKPYFYKPTGEAVWKLPPGESSGKSTARKANVALEDDLLYHINMPPFKADGRYWVKAPRFNKPGVFIFRFSKKSEAGGVPGAVVLRHSVRAHAAVPSAPKPERVKATPKKKKAAKRKTQAKMKDFFSSCSKRGKKRKTTSGPPKRRSLLSKGCIAAKEVIATAPAPGPPSEMLRIRPRKPLIPKKLGMLQNDAMPAKKKRRASQVFEPSHLYQGFCAGETCHLFGRVALYYELLHFCTEKRMGVPHFGKLAK